MRRIGKRGSRCSWTSILVAMVAGITLLLAGTAPAAARTQSAKSEQVPLFAYYYIWFNPTSWMRAKTDYPTLGRYSSDERDVMRKQIEWAKQSGINGFIVSWKSTEVLDRRLQKLIDVAEQEHFKLAIIYQGLNFQRQPLPVKQVANDMDFFIRRYARSKAFKFFDKPLMIWSGTWRFSRDQVGSVTRTHRDRLLLLGSEKDLAGYERIGDLLDGNAYYWSSVNPDTYPGYGARLKSLGGAVHARHGLWLAPAAPGFDALLIGGTSVVERKGGETLRKEYNAAASSSPDAIGLISWNEFSENSYIEPSQRYGARYLRVLADIRGAKAPRVGDFDSSNDPASTATSYGPVVIGALFVLIVGALFIVLRRRAEPRETREGTHSP